MIWPPVEPRLRRLYDLCVTKGLSTVMQDSEDGAVHFPDWREAVFGGRAATYLSFEKRLYFNPKGLPPYAPYRPDVHELGHAVWHLLLTGRQKWLEYAVLWAKGRIAGKLETGYAAEKPEEGFAEDFEAYFTEGLRSSITRSLWMTRMLLGLKVP